MPLRKLENEEDGHASAAKMRRSPARKEAEVTERAALAKTAARIRRSFASALVKKARLRIVANQIDTILVAVEKPVDLARMLGVSPAQVTRWRAGQLPDPGNSDRLRRLADTVGLLLQSYPPKVAGAWFQSPNVHPEDGGGTPADLIRRGQWDVLRAYAEEAASGGYG